VASVDDSATAGDEVCVVDPRGNTLGRGLYSPSSAIAVRIFTQRDDEAIDAELFSRRIERAYRRRLADGLPSREPGQQTNAYRLIYGEGDGLPGLMVDVFDDVFVVQFASAGLQQRQAAILDALWALFEPRAIVDRTPPGVARAEGFTPNGGVLRGEKAVQFLRFRERGLRYELPLSLGQKTGYYFDQRPLRGRIESLAPGCNVLDGCCYVGSFAMSAARAGARSVLAVDKSATVIEAARHCAELNGLTDRIEFVVQDVNPVFAKVAEKGGVDVVICDPPKLTTGRHGTGSRRVRNKALGAYERLARASCSATAPGALLAFCCCSAAVDNAALTRALAIGAKQAGRRALVLERHLQGPDHPVPAAFPEGLYLRILLARIESP